MTELREQLLSARDEYRSTRYPGELAAELLPPAPAGQPAPRPWGVRTFVVRLAGVAIAAAAAVTLVIVRPPDQVTAPTPAATDSRVAPAVATAARPGDPQGWWFAPDLTFASAAAERVKTVATRVQMRMTLPYRDLKMPAMPELPTLPWPEWTRGRDSGGDAETQDDAGSPPSAAPSTQRSA